MARTYWFFGVFVGLAVTLLVKVLNLTDDAVGLALLALFSAPYGIVVLVGIWRASSKYTGSAVWRFLARAVVVLNGIGLVLTLVTFGLGISKDIEPFPQAADLLHRAEQGDPEAQNNLAAMYHFGEGVPQNHVEAAEWLRLAAEQGYALAQYNLGVMYHLGDGVSQSQVEAAKWFQLAAEQGHANAQNSLGALAARMTREQITEAQRLAAEWMDQHQGDN